MAMIKKIDNNNCGQGCRKKGDPFPCWQECISEAIMKNILKVITTILLYNPPIQPPVNS